MTTDATLESLTSLLCDNPRGLLFVQDELAAWTRALGQYKMGRGNDRQKWLAFWSGASETVNRKGADPIFIARPFVCVTGCIQPDMLGELVDRNGRQDGFLDRVLVSYPNSIPVRWTDDGVLKKTKQQYAALFRLLWCGKIKTKDHCEQVLQLTTAAKKAWKQWIARHHTEQNELSDELRGVWAKLEAYCGRLALILHRCRSVAKETKSANVDRESVERATKLVEYFKSHARRVYRRVRRDSDDSRIGKAVRWIRKQGGKVTARDVQRAGIASVTDSEESMELFKDLEETGHGTISTGSRKDSLVFTLSDT